MCGNAVVVFVSCCCAAALDVSVLNSLFSVADADGNGKVSYREFEAVMSGRRVPHSHALHEANAGLHEQRNWHEQMNG